MSGERRGDYIDLTGKIASLETKVDALIGANQKVLEIMTGNGTPEHGLSFRVAQMEGKEKGKETNSKAIWTFLSSLGVLVIADWIHRTFFHK